MGVGAFLGNAAKLTRPAPHAQRSTLNDPRMPAIRLQYFLFFAVAGSTLPFLSIYFEQVGLSRSQIGYIFAVAGLGILITPVLLTLLADVKLEQRFLLAVTFGCSALMLLGLMSGVAFLWVLLSYGLFWLVYSGVGSLQDGLFFTVKAQQNGGTDRAHEPTQGYHRTRVFGTLGFLTPSLLLFFLLDAGWPLISVIVCSAALCVVGVGNAFFLPRTRHDVVEHRDADDPKHGELKGPGTRLPTFAAAGQLFRPPLLIFCVAIFLTHMSAAAFYTFYPVYLVSEAGIPEKWAGPIAALGVVLELIPMLAFGWLVNKIGMRGVLILGAGAMTLRMVLLAWFPVPGVAVGTQVLHGMMVLLIHIAPPVVINKAAGAGYRNSMQGLFTMSVYGGGRMLGGAVAGWIADWSLLGMFWYASVCAGVAMVLLMVAGVRGESDQ